MIDTIQQVEEDDLTKTTVTYTCEVKDMQYTVIGDNIKNDFKFLIDDIPSLLETSLTYLNQATEIKDAFYFENNAKVQDLTHVYEEINQDIKQLNQELADLHAALITDIDNVNAELASNFGHIAFYSTAEAGRVVEEKAVSE